MIIPLRRDQAITKDGFITRRFAEYLESLNQGVGTSTEGSTIEVNNSNLFELQASMGSGDPLTSDETGFTVDSTALTVDMTES